MSGRNGAEWVAEIGRNMHPLSLGSETEKWSLNSAKTAKKMKINFVLNRYA